MSRARARRSSKRSAGKDRCRARLDEQRAARDSENAIEDDVTKIESTSPDVASPIGQRAAPQQVTRERETRDSSKSDAEFLNEPLQRSNLCELNWWMSSKRSSVRSQSSGKEVTKDPASLQKEIDTCTVDSDANRCHRCMAFSSVDGE